MLTFRRFAAGLALILGLGAFLALSGLASAGGSGPIAAFLAQQTGTATVTRTATVTATATGTATVTATVTRTTAVTTPVTVRTTAVVTATVATTPRTTIVVTTPRTMTTTAIVPTRGPQTGGGGASGQSSPLLWLTGVGLVALMAAGAAYVLRGRRI